MFLSSLSLTNFRNLATQDIDFERTINVIAGHNGAGKTALLEALYFLSRGKSFRESNPRHLIAHGQDFFRLTTHFSSQEEAHFLGVEKSAKKITVKLDGAGLKNLGAMAKLIPLQIINSDHFSLINHGPQFRRQFSDYGLFHTQADFYPTWRRYQYALKNRNLALQQNLQEDFIRPWDHMLSDEAQRIHQLRSEYLKTLEETLNFYHAELGGMQLIHIRYYAGWNQEHSLLEHLSRHLMRDRQVRHTRYGAHRADWRLLCDKGYDVAHTFSRGQQKTLLCALLLAQTDLIRQQIGKNPLILLDDISSELDKPRIELLLTFLQSAKSQIFITTIEPLTLHSSARQFSIDEGKITQK